MNKLIAEIYYFAAKSCNTVIKVSSRLERNAQKLKDKLIQRRIDRLERCYIKKDGRVV